ncbi:MAG: hypothetical protein ACF8R7_11455 [Phycisphaerales bacterium JB039]
MIATAVALCAFAIGLIAGLAAGNPSQVVLGRALVGMVVCYVVGHVLGACAESVVRRRVDAYKREHPVPDVFAALNGPDGASEARSSAAAA